MKSGRRGRPWADPGRGTVTFGGVQQMYCDLIEGSRPMDVADFSLLSHHLWCLPWLRLYGALRGLEHTGSPGFHGRAG